VATAGILLGTLYPLIHEAINGEANMVSVGPPYFNTIFLPLMALLALFLTVGSISRWKKTSTTFLKEQLMKVAIASVALGILLPLAITQDVNFGIFLAVALALWIVLGIARDIQTKISNKDSLLQGLKSLSLGYYGMQLAHSGMAVIILGVCLTSHYSVEEDVRLAPGESIVIGSYEFIFEGVTNQPGPNYDAEVGLITVLKNGEDYLQLRPEKRTYFATGAIQTEADIDVGLFRDLFAALGDPRGEGAWVVRIHLKPFVLWIWLGAFIMATGGITAILDRRYRTREKVSQQDKVVMQNGKKADTAMEGA
jgi:cytochrome c-type biogenesis protein CcmF